VLWNVSFVKVKRLLKMVLHLQKIDDINVKIVKKLWLVKIREKGLKSPFLDANWL